VTVAERHTYHVGWARTIELSPRLPDNERPSDYASLAAERVDLDNVINELLSRLADHKIVGSPTKYELTDAAEAGAGDAITDHLQAAAHTGKPAVLDPLRYALFRAHPDR
jgi:hypothetical protein